VQVPRTRYGDDLIEELDHNGATQLVLLGAGMDTRAYRLNTLRNWTVFEVDLDETFAVKEPLLADQPVCCAKRVTISADFTTMSTGDLVQQMLDSGFDRSVPSVFLLEGLMMYLDAETSARIIRSVTALAASGSVVFHDAISATYLREGIAVHGAPFIGASDDYAEMWGAANFNTTVLDMNYSVRVDRRKRGLIVDRSQIATPARIRGRNVVLFVESRRR
jgi:methyltransferase (TIGR00027 family)